MKILKSMTYLNDLDKSIRDTDALGEMRYKTILITGATGMIGSTIVDLLIRLNVIYDLNIKIYACSRKIENLKQRFGDSNKNLFFLVYDANRNISFDVDADYIIHGASNASPRLYTQYPVETMDVNYFGMKNLLDYGLKHETERIVYISSSEVYGVVNKSEPLSEGDYGEIDILDPRSSYSSGKRATETLCASYVKEFGSNVMIARPGHIYGPSANYNDNRIASLFLREAAQGKDLVMKSKGRQLRSYTYSVDCANAILYILLRGNKGEAYNISNRESIISIKDMANIVSKTSHVNLSFDIPKTDERKDFNPMDNSSLDSTKIEKLGWQGLFGYDVGFLHTIEILKGR